MLFVDCLAVFLSQVKDDENAANLVAAKGAIEFSNVSFNYQPT
jgi:ABC-type transport system involved in Fe-S cluster assembly fused permease/ATPase subunit